MSSDPKTVLPPPIAEEYERVERKSADKVWARINTLVLVAILFGVAFLVFIATVYTQRARTQFETRLDQLNTTNRVLSERLERNATLAEQRRVAVAIKNAELDVYENNTPDGARQRAIMRGVLHEYLSGYDTSKPKTDDLIKAEACAMFQERGIRCPE